MKTNSDHTLSSILATAGRGKNLFNRKKSAADPDWVFSSLPRQREEGEERENRRRPTTQ